MDGCPDKPDPNVQISTVTLLCKSNEIKKMNFARLKCVFVMLCGGHCQMYPLRVGRLSKLSVMQGEIPVSCMEVSLLSLSFSLSPSLESLHLFLFDFLYICG